MAQSKSLTPLKRNSRLEKFVLAEVADWLASRQYFFWRANNIPVFGMSNDGKKRFRALPKHTPRGLPDIMVVFRGRFIALECKREGAALRPEQIIFRDELVKNGGHYYVVTGSDQLIDIPELI